MSETAIIPSGVIENHILLVRGQKVILDSSLAKLYGVPTGRLNEQVKRNKHRFPEDFMFQLLSEEVEILKSQIAISSSSHGGRRFLPYAFTEHGVIMAANILNTHRATEVSVLVVRTFVRLRQILTSHKELSIKLAELEGRLGTHDKAIQSLFTAIRQLMAAPSPKNRKIGFLIK